MPSPPWNWSDLEALVSAAASGSDTEIHFRLVSREGTDPRQFRADVVSAGATVLVEDASLGYLVASAPVGHIDAIRTLPRLLAIEVADEAELRPHPIRAKLDLPPRDGQPIDLPVQAAHVVSEVSSAHTGVTFAGLERIRRVHPEYDGRGVLAAVHDKTCDAAHPALQHALTWMGKRVRKLVEVVPTGTPKTGGGWAHSWIECKPLVDRTSPDGHRYRLPDRDGDYYFGLLSDELERALTGSPSSDGSPSTSQASQPRSDGAEDVQVPIGVLWDRRSDTMWIDLDRTLDFTATQSVKPYSQTGDLAVLPDRRTADHTVSEVDQWSGQESFTGYLAEPDPTTDRVWLCPIGSRHGTGVVGTLAGVNYLGRGVDGAAPGAQVHLTLALTDYLTWLLRVLRDGAVDLATSQIKVDAIDGSYLSGVVIDRLIRSSGKPLLWSAGNSPHLSLGQAKECRAEVISVGGYRNRVTWRFCDGEIVDGEHYVAPVSAYGPGPNGAISPTVLAPTDSLASCPVTMHGDLHLMGEDSEAGRARIPLPPGYNLLGGTSQAAPMAAGVVATLISAAKQTGLTYDHDRIRRALIMGAQFLDDYPAHAQGNGLIQADRSWEILRRLSDKEMIRVSSRGTVRTIYSHRFTTPHEGPGIYEREGWRRGDSGRRIVRLRRHNGPEAPQEYELHWKGNDGTFRTADAVTLPLLEWVELPISIDLDSEGVHSAILELHDSEADLVHQLMTTVVAAVDLDDDRTLTRIGQLAWPSRHGLYVRVPENVPAMTVRCRADAGDLVFTLKDPSHPNEGTTRVVGDKIVKSQGNYLQHVTAGESRAMTVTDPMPGVWEIAVANEFLNDSDSMSRTEPEPSSHTRSGRSQETGFAVDVVVKEAGGRRLDDDRVEATVIAGVGRWLMVGAPLIARRHETVRVKPGAIGHNQVITVPDGATHLSITVSDPRNLAEPDLFLVLDQAEPLNDTPPIVRDRAQGQVHKLEVPSPTAGTYQLTIGGYQLPADGLEMDVLIDISRPEFGQTAVADQAATRRVGDAWQADYRIEQRSHHGDGHQLIGHVLVAEPSPDIEGDQSEEATNDPHQPTGNAAIIARIQVAQGAT